MFDYKMISNGIYWDLHRHGKPAREGNKCRANSNASHSANGIIPRHFVVVIVVCLNDQFSDFERTTKVNR